MRLAQRAATIGSGILLLLSVPVLAQVVVPSTASLQLNGGSLDLGGTDLQLAGACGLGSGHVDNAASVAIAAGGSLDGGSGTITLSGNWSNAGTFSTGSGVVNFVDGANAQSDVSGNSTFANASFISTVGKTYAFAVGSTQTINGLLTILGASTQGIQFKSATAGQVASIDLLNGGSQNIDFVGVSNVHGTGQQLAPTKTNDGGSGDAIGWFGNNAGTGGSVAPTPMLSTLALWLLGLLLLALTALFHPAARRR